MDQGQPAAAAKGAGVPTADLKRRIRERFEPIRKAYVDFLARHPDHARARVAYGSFLGDLQDEDGAREQWEKALALNPKDPAVYNNLANLYGHTGPVKKAFEYYAKAIELNPQRAHLLSQLRHHRVPVPQGRDGVLPHHRAAGLMTRRSSFTAKPSSSIPDNFPLASDVAQTYYGIKPLRTDDALNAWTNTLAIAHDEIEREGVYLHLARIKLAAERFAEARAHLNGVTNDMYDELKKRLAHNLDEQEARPRGPTRRHQPRRSKPLHGSPGNAFGVRERGQPRLVFAHSWPLMLTGGWQLAGGSDPGKVAIAARLERNRILSCGFQPTTQPPSWERHRRRRPTGNAHPPSGTLHHRFTSLPRPSSLFSCSPRPRAASLQH